MHHKIKKQILSITSQLKILDNKLIKSDNDKDTNSLLIRINSLVKKRSDLAKIIGLTNWKEIDLEL
jgi:hypothetical protein